MKKISAILAAVLILASVSAQAPEKMSYQAIIRNSNNELVINQTIGMQISILKGSANGTAVYTETQTPTTNNNGLVSLEIGNGTIVSGNFTTIDWANGIYYIKTETDPEGNKNYTITGTNQLLTVPYAMHSKTAETVIGAITENQNLADVIANNNSANGQIKNVTNPTELQDAATKAYVDAMKEIIYNGILDTILKGVVLDNDGNTYKTIKIGEQVWMAENLKTTKYNDGNDIPLINNQTDWSNLITPGYCWYDFKEDPNKQVYGALYNFYVVNTGLLCPEGWHVPNELEWSTLFAYLGSAGEAGGKLKETGTKHWKDPNTGATNESRFTALPGGFIFSTGLFINKGATAYWWSSSPMNANAANAYHIHYNETLVNTGSLSNKCGNSIRCVKD
jgi:uncharacterized protein (TIGR02145 family)